MGKGSMKSHGKYRNFTTHVEAWTAKCLLHYGMDCWSRSFFTSQMPVMGLIDSVKSMTKFM